MNRSKVEILKEEIVLPEVVVAAAEDAFDKILREASMEKVEKMEVACMKSRKPKFKKRWVALVAVAALVVGTLSVGAVKSDDWNWNLMQFAGVKEPEAIETIQLESGYVQINAADTCEGTNYLAGGKKEPVTLTVTESFGDNNNIFVRIETDYALPDDFPAEDYNYFADFTLDAVDVNKKVNMAEVLTYGPLSFAGMQGKAENGKLVFFLEMGGIDLNVCRMDLTVENFYIYSNQFPVPEEFPAFYNDLPSKDESNQKMIYEGKWAASWQYDYTVIENVYEVDESLVLEGVKVDIEEIILSPINIKVKGEIDKDSVKALVTEAEWNKLISEKTVQMKDMDVSEEEIEQAVISNILEPYRADFKVYKICYKDGSYVEPYASNPLSDVWGDVLLDANTLLYAGQGIELDKVHSIIVMEKDGNTNSKKEIILK